ncbi:MAG TPA: hypothetical protein DDW52_23430 [Planctomycetaceae bacterium]|nr:hypothetical protein [Planctomycetaceae bacterium]
MTQKNLLHLFEQAIEKPPEQRIEFLDKLCGKDKDLHQKLVAMLDLHADASSFLDTDAIKLTEDTSDPTAAFISSNSEPSRLKLGDRLLGRYEVVAAIGRGGMGEVYRCSDLQLQRQVAIKVQRLAIEDDPTTRDRFLREIRSVAALSHLNIVMLHDFATDDEISFAVMEFVDGVSLAEWRSEERETNEILTVAAGIASGLSAAHSKDLMHRDIKPANVMISEYGIAKILDFGLARLQTKDAASDITGEFGQIPGTVPYMSPEQARGDRLTCATDVFSFGTVLYEMFVGNNPYRGETLLETLAMVSDASRIRECLKEAESIPPVISQLIDAMQNRSPEQRPTAAIVADTIQQYLRSEHDTTSAFSMQATDSPNNLPERQIELEGRQNSIKVINEQIDQSPIVTIVGTGGVGKTSLATHLAQQRRNKYAGGVWFCDFSSVDQTADLAGVVASHVTGNAGSFSGLDELITRLSGAPVLLVLDNCEHVIDAAAELAETLCDRLSEITILATSREALDIDRERIHRLAGLAVTGLDCDAAELFRNRASSVVDLKMDQNTRESIHDIVVQLEGLPLAIELAASCLSTMTVNELQESLFDQLSIQKGRRRRSRQATLNRAIEWSYDLLSQEEQEMLQQLTVFRAAFSAEAALKVCGLTEAGRNVLRSLVEKSMLSRTDFGDESRFRLLEPIRQFCQQTRGHLENPEIHERHAVFYANRAKKLGKGINGFDELNCAESLNREWPDLRAAIAWGREQLRFDVAVIPIVDLARNIMFHLRTEAYGWLIEAEQLFPKEFETRADVLWVLANGHWIMANPQLCESVLDRADAIKVSPQTLWVRYFLRFSQNRFEESIAAAEEAERLAEASQDPIEQRWWANAFKACPMAMANPEDPRIDPTIQASRRHVNGLDWPTGRAFFALAEGTVLINRRQMPQAIEKYQEIIKIAKQCGNLWIELISRLVFNEAANPNIPPSVKLEHAIADLRSLLENGEEAHFPIAVRCIVIALSDCGFLEEAVRCSSIVSGLPGVGERNEFTPTYPDSIEALRLQFSAQKFEDLNEQGATLVPGTILELAEESLKRLDGQL